MPQLLFLTDTNEFTNSFTLISYFALGFRFFHAPENFFRLARIEALQPLDEPLFQVVGFFHDHGDLGNRRMFA